ncbi:hypothetical protein PPACK8108_LOCUS18510 [Phakopsora pachyrhizi]|uniref:Uncharacterized protein n=1 Tax=Phakopsora pachyrhizi TaxID=170000 RepID=A0AAV0BB50_PHAPC|nr:hypothetical protein PPACK8108_LOCUS18510 [Phakopsora pachyrhizi]
MASDFSRWAMGMEMEGGGKGQGAQGIPVLPGNQGEGRGRAGDFSRWPWAIA